MAKIVNQLELDVSGFIKSVKTALGFAGKLEDVDATVDVHVDSSEVTQASTKIEGLSRTETVKVDVDTDKAQTSVSSFGAGIGAALGGAALQGLSALGTGLLEGAEAADAFGDTLSVAFKGQGLADVNGEIDKVRESTLQLANDLGIPVARTRELATAVATVGGLSGDQAQGLTKLSTSLEIFTDGAVKGEAVVKAFSRGIADPEGAAAIDALSKKYPQLAETLRGTASASEKLAAANSILGPSFAEAVSGAQDAGGSLQRVKNAVNETFENVGGKIAETIGPVFDLLIKNADTLIPIVITLAAAVGAYALAINASAIATGIASAATVIWEAILNANPVGLVAVAVVALTAGVIALADAFSESAEETLDNAEANKKLIETQIKSNKENQVAVAGTKSLAKEFEELAGKTKRTAEEEKRLQTIQGDLDKQYPDLIDQTKSFKDNLQGVAEIGKATTASLADLGKQGTQLQEQLAKSVKVIAGAKRNVALDELRDQLDRVSFNPLAGTNGNKFRKAWADIREEFERGIFTAKTQKDIDTAQSKVLEFLNKASEQTGQLGDIDSKKIDVLYGGVANVVGSATAALEAFGLVKATPKIEPVVTAAPIKRDASKDFQEAQTAVAKYRKELEAVTAIEADRIESQIALGKITREAGDIQLKALQKEDLVKVVAKAQEIFKAVKDSDAFALSTKIKGVDEKEAIAFVNTFQLELNKLNRVTVDVEPKLIPFDPNAIRRSELKAFKPFALPARIEITKDKGLFDDLANAINEIDYGDLFEPLTEGADDAAQKIADSFKQGAIDYQNALKEMDTASEVTESAFDRVAIAGSKVLETSAQSLQGTALKFTESADTIDTAIKLMSISTAASFASMALAGENVWTAIAKAAFDGLQQLVPIFSAQILAGALATPQSIITGGGAGLLEWAALTALIQTAVSGARAGLGFKDGGPTGDHIGRNAIAGVVHGEEFVAPTKMYRKHGDLLHHLYANKPLSAFPEIQEMLSKAGIGANAQVIIQAPQPSSYSVDGLAGMRGELVAIRSQLQSMETLHKSSTGVVVSADEDSVIRSINKNRIKVGRR